MKLLPALFLPLLAILLSSCGPPKATDTPAKEEEATTPPKEADYKKLGYANDIFTDPDTKKPFTGIARQKYPDGTTQGEYPFKNGRFHGMVKEWYKNGKPSAETEFVNGERTGKNIEWTEAGLIYRERVYDHDKIVSEKNHEAGK